ncbi:MAG: DUF2007 domain-containing protein, partial [Prevotellaceae bacterium]|jgi:nitrogen fixation protein FixH|nr:DUF2007 domain-containing protein [Prevotellaceae bacterium]
MVFHSLPQAKIIEGLLISSGIECFLSNETGTILNPIFERGNESIKLHVLESDVLTAKEILTGLWQTEDSDKPDANE